VTIEVGYLKKSSWAVKFSGIARIGRIKACEAELTATLGALLKNTGNNI
jgi:hypothetical protein